MERRVERVAGKGQWRMPVVTFYTESLREHRKCQDPTIWFLGFGRPAGWLCHRALNPTSLFPKRRLGAGTVAATISSEQEKPKAWIMVKRLIGQGFTRFSQLNQKDTVQESRFIYTAAHQGCALQLSRR
jgi:hypothetical protein